MATAHYFLVLALATVAFGKNIFPAEADDSGRLIDPFVPGDYPINHTAYRQALNLFLDTNIDVYAPNAAGNFPVFYFITGFGGRNQLFAETMRMMHTPETRCFDLELYLKINRFVQALFLPKRTLNSFLRSPAMELFWSLSGK